MDSQATAVFLRFFTGMKDPRRHNRRHLLSDILTITILAMMCGSDDWPQVVEWAKARHAWLAEFLPLPSGLPGEDTFRRVLARIDPLAFEQCFQDWTRAVAECSEGQVVSFDGKTMRGSFGCGKQGMAHLVSAWCTHNRLVLGQLAVEDKSNEIIAIPKLLELLNLKGAVRAVVTIDAMGCQRAIAQKIRQKEADYVLAVKDNQPALCQKMDAVMQDVILDLAKGLPVSCGYDERTSGGHGRIETRRVWVSNEVEALGPELAASQLRPRIIPLRLRPAPRRIDRRARHAAPSFPSRPHPCAPGDEGRSSGGRGKLFTSPFRAFPVSRLRAPDRLGVRSPGFNGATALRPWKH